MPRAAPAIALLLLACGSGGRRGPTQILPPQPPPPPACEVAAPVVEPILPGDMVQDLGTLRVGTGASFVVADGTASFLIFSQEVANSAVQAVLFGGGTLPNVVVPTDLRAPDGTIYYDDFAEWPTTTIGTQEYFDVSGMLGYDLAGRPVSGAFAVPNTSGALGRVLDAGEIQPGTWSFTVNDWAHECSVITGCSGASGSGEYRVHVVTRPGPVPEPGTGTLDVEVYLATDPGSALSTPAAAVAHPQIPRWIESLRAYLANGGVALGEVTFRELPPEVKERHAPNGVVDVTDSTACGDLPQLFTAATAARRAVHLFLADELVANFGTGPFTVLGVDGSIPGPSGFPGTIYGGAIVGLFDELGDEASPGACGGPGPTLACGTDLLAYVAAHEIGHWLGLYHTTEQPGVLFDPLSDTGRCPCHSCAPASARGGCYEVAPSRWTTSVTNGMCRQSESCGGGRNLMFWLVDAEVSTGELSREQGQIVRLNPAVR